MAKTPQSRGRSTSSSPDPLGGTPRISTQSTDRDLAGSPEPFGMEDGPSCSPDQECSDVGGLRDIHDVPQVEEEEEEEEDSRESPSFEGVNFSSGFDFQPGSTTSFRSPNRNVMKTSQYLSSDSLDEGIQALKGRTPHAERESFLPNLPNMPHSRYPISSQLPSATLVDRNTPPPKQRKYTESPLKHHLDGKQEPPGRSRTTRLQDLLISHPVAPPKNLALASIKLGIAATIPQAGKSGNATEKNVFEDPDSSGSISLEIARAEPFPLIRQTVSSFRTKRYQAEDTDEDSIEALRNHGPIRPSLKDSSRHTWRLPGSSTLFGSDWTKANTSLVDEDDGGGDGFGDDVVFDTVMEETGGMKIDIPGRGLTRRRRPGTGDGASEIENQSNQSAPSHQISSDVPFGPSRTNEISPESSTQPRTEASKGLRTIIEQDIDHRTLSTRRAPHRRPSFVYMPPGRRRSAIPAERQPPHISSDEDGQDLPSLEELELPRDPKRGPLETRKRSLTTNENEDPDDDYVQDRPPKKKRNEKRKGRNGKLTKPVEMQTDSERKAIEDRLRQIQEIDAYELEVVYEI